MKKKRFRSIKNDFDSEHEINYKKKNHTYNLKWR